MERRIGNFKVYEDSDGEHEYVVLSTVGGEWEVSYREDHPMYAAWVHMMSDEGCGKAMEVLSLMYYMLTNVYLDDVFVKAFFDAHGEMMERKALAVSDASEEEQAEALKEAMMLNEMIKGNG